MVHVLFPFQKNSSHSNESFRKEVYKRLYGILFHGNKIGVTEVKTFVTYVYPLELRKEIRSRFPDVDSVSRDAEYDAKPDTTTVTWQHLKEATWPKPPNSCVACKQSSTGGRYKPY